MKRFVTRWGILLVCLGVGYLAVQRLAKANVTPKRTETIESRLKALGPQVDARWKPWFEAAEVSYPPKRILLVGLKEEKRLDLYAASDEGMPYRWVRSFPVLAASGEMGPKKQEGDRQVPEGFYEIEYLNPNSLYHLSMKISYPNAFDRKYAEAEGRTNLGGDIMIHGKSASIGCLAMGDKAAEDLFVLVARSGIPSVEVIFSPVDFRTDKRSLEELAKGQPEWVLALYKKLKMEVLKLSSGGPSPDGLSR